MTTTMTHDRVLTTQRDGELAQEVLGALAGSAGSLAVQQGEAVMDLPPEVGRILQQVLAVMARGGTVVVGAMPAELTTTTAAAVLGISRPTLMKMIRSGEIPARQVGSHHRLKQEDVYAARRARRERERQALRERMELEDADD